MMVGQREEPDRIVVGVDGSDESQQALQWALRQAELTGGVVQAVTAWEIPQFYGGLGWMPPSNADQSALETQARGELDNAVEEAAKSWPSVEVRTEARYGTAVRVLLDAADGAALLVVGSRGRGGVSKLLLGSVAQKCTQLATCPVVVVRGGEAGDR
jgi:nucleotide-binding universal stress UspA family protein